MDDREFLESLKTDEERFDELTVGAEHFVRLKRQSGYVPNSEVDKEAAIKKPPFARFMEGAISGSPLDHLAQGMRRAVKGPNKAGGAGKATAAVLGGAGMFAAGRHSVKKKEKRAEIESSDDFQKTATAPSMRIERLRERRPDVVEKHPDIFAEKRASAAEKLKSLGPLALGLMGAGAVVGGVGTYAASKPREDLGGKSRAEDELSAQVDSQQSRPENGLLHKLKNRTTELEHGYAKAFRDHPNKASLLGAGAGAVGGYGLARLLDAVRGAR